VVTTLSDPAAWIAGLTTFVLVGLCVTLHYEALNGCNLWLQRLRKRRQRVVVMIGIVLLTHIAEIWVFALGYWFFGGSEDLGRIAGIEGRVFSEHVYFSAIVYTTVGFGDLIPLGHTRFLAAVEALTALVLIAWSASFTFLEMQRSWGSR
jgi:ion channel